MFQLNALKSADNHPLTATISCRLNRLLHVNEALLPVYYFLFRFMVAGGGNKLLAVHLWPCSIFAFQ